MLLRPNLAGAAGPLAFTLLLSLHALACGGDPTGPYDSGPLDSTSPDGGTGADSGPLDSDVLDAREDAGDADLDSSPPDTGAPDTGGADSGGPDSGAPDSGDLDSGDPDTGAPDAGRDDDGDGYTAGVDCDDGNPAVHPGALEICDGLDTDCDPTTDEPNALLLDGAPVASVAVAMSMGGTIEVCGVFPYLWSGPRFANAVTVIGHTSDAALEMHSSTGRMDFEDGVDASFESLTVRADIGDEILGIRMRDANLTLRDMRFLGLRSPITMTLGVVTMTGGEVSGSRDGNGVYLDRSDATLTNVLFDDNEVRHRTYGGGALLVSLGSTATIDGCTFTRNRNALGAGGAVYLGVIPSRDWGQATMVATNSTWGAGAPDNAPDDVVAWYGPGSSGAVVDDVAGDIRCVANSSGNSCAAP